MTWILAQFGYVKVPKGAIKEAILICMTIEDQMKAMIVLLERPDLERHFKVCVKAVQTLTNFLRCGKLLNGGSS